MQARKKGQQYEITYRCPGYRKPFSERFPTPEEAQLRIAQIELDKSRGQLRPPKELLLKAARPKQSLVTVRLVLAHDDGRPFEERQIMDKLRLLESSNDLKPVVFHSLRHCSTSVKLQLSGGDIKAVQGDTGHAQSRMVTDLYAHIDNEDRRQLAQKLEDGFFRREAQQERESGDDNAEVLRLLKENPDMAKLILGILGAKRN